MRHTLLLNADGAAQFGCGLIVIHPTDVVYFHQAGGTATVLKSQEGFFVPLGCVPVAAKLRRFFQSRFGGDSTSVRMKDADVDETQSLLSEVPVWSFGGETAEDRVTFLSVNELTRNSSVEGWVPVDSAYGPAIFIFDNSD
ncbi:DUF6210 family protein [Stratiformator vulcanicus]|uniref:Uncharacterized protein n=1 Tax=Stratiformator vulcanicus TaxID=2527980 RepID=A0A517QZW0_9PLAN|nr:DUF6210 family protein [Stratiformator vulcanicus]QDT37185.1 hypothetical protein Pan189_15570 [Stratiformator vulcanicus]